MILDTRKPARSIEERVFRDWMQWLQQEDARIRGELTNMASTGLRYPLDPKGELQKCDAPNCNDGIVRPKDGKPSQCERCKTIGFLGITIDVWKGHRHAPRVGMCWYGAAIDTDSDLFVQASADSPEKALEIARAAVNATVSE